MMYKKYFAILLLSSILALPLGAKAQGSASINLSPKSGSYKVGETFSMAVSVDPAGGKIDTARVKLSFSQEFLEVKSFSIGSAFSYQAGANSFDNKTGSFSWGAGVPGGTSAPSAFGTIVFGVKKEGAGKISVSKDSLVLSAGEDRFNGQESTASFSLLAAAAAPAKKSSNKTAPVGQLPEEEGAANLTEEQPINKNNSVETQIIPNMSPKSFTASLAGLLSLATMMRIGVALLIALIIILLAMVFYKMKPKEDLASFFKKSNTKK